MKFSQKDAEPNAMKSPNPDVRSQDSCPVQWFPNFTEHLELPGEFKTKWTFIPKAQPELEAPIKGPRNLHALKCSQGILWLSQLIWPIPSMNKEGFC